MPRLALIATGGTIAGTGTSQHYTAATLGAMTLVDAVPGLRTLADWQVEQPFSIDSRDMQPGHWLQLAAIIQTQLDDSSIDGAVVTHGTDTLEETAFALHLLLPTGKPVVITAAMRPAGSLSADGPLNLLQAARVALASSSSARGALVVANDQIHSARFVAKTHTHAPDALSSPGAGPEGAIFDQAVRYRRPAPAIRNAILAIPPDVELPRVDLITSFAGMDSALMDASLAAGAKGIVLALAGHGSIPTNLRPAISHAQSQGVVIVRASRIGAGVMRNHNEHDDENHFVTAEQLNALQARILLMLALASNLSVKGIADLFALS